MIKANKSSNKTNKQTKTSKERQLSLLKRKAFKNVEQIIFKGAQKNKQRNELLPNVQQ